MTGVQTCALPISLKNWLAPVVETSPAHEGELLKPAVVSILALLLVLAGVGLAIVKYLRAQVPAEAPTDVSIFTRIARRDLLQDDFNEAVFMRPGQKITQVLVATDEVLVDGAVRGVAHLTQSTGRTLGMTQTGFVRSYAMWIVLGAIGLLATIWVVTL